VHEPGNREASGRGLAPIHLTNAVFASVLTRSDNEARAATTSRSSNRKACADAQSEWATTAAQSGEMQGKASPQHFSRKVMLDGKTRGGAARINPQLPVDRLNMHIDGVWAEDELLGYLILGEPYCHQA
jgi:hypothetical protein